MSDLRRNATRYLQERYPHATVLSEDRSIVNNETNKVTKVTHVIIAQDWESGIKQRLLAVPNLGADKEVVEIAKHADTVFQILDAATYIARLDTDTDPKEHALDTNNLVLAPKVILYTDSLHLANTAILNIFRSQRLLVDIVQEKETYDSVFISYGAPDEKVVATINDVLESEGIQTWFFPSDALPGQKLHRTLHDGVNKYDKVLLVCSAMSLQRHGALSEIERVLEREAREGGSAILMPISLDGFVYTEWAPRRPDLADQVRSRVITRFPNSTQQTDEFRIAAKKLTKAIRKQPTPG